MSFFLILFPVCCILNKTQKAFHQMDQKFIEELRQKYIKNPPEGMTAKLVRNMTDSDVIQQTTFNFFQILPSK